MKKLLYTIALAGGVTFLPTVQGTNIISEEENQIIESTRARIAQIKQERKLEKERLEAELCSFDYQRAIDIFERRSQDFFAMQPSLYDPNISLQELRDTYPQTIQFEQDLELIPDTDFTGYNDQLLLAINILKRAGVNKRENVRELTADEMDKLICLGKNMIMNSTIFKGQIKNKK